MTGRSIRTFALDYYRQQGARIQPLGENAAYEIVPPNGASLTVTFTGDDMEPSWVPLTPTSPQWRTILEDLTANVAVSYRYLTAGPIQSPATVLEAALPEGWHVRTAKLARVETRAGVAFTHRVTFDAPALNVREENIQTHLWDLETGERLSSLEPHLFTARCLLFRPEALPAEETLQRLVDQSLALVDVESDRQGESIERELTEMLAEAERRTNQYFDQQMANVLQREATIAEKLDTTIRKLGEAKTPEQVTRFRQEGEQLSQQIEHLKARREADLAAVEAACTAKLDTERERHELTATTDLVAICHVRYDVVTYRIEARHPDGCEANWEVSYCPLTMHLELPECAVCESPLQMPQALQQGSWACEACIISCTSCGARHEAGSVHEGACGLCAVAVCSSCEAGCTHCESTLCTEHAAECGTCEAPLCLECALACAECADNLCASHAHRDAVNGLHYCAEHQPVAQLEPVTELAPVVSEPTEEPSAILLESEALEVVEPAPQETVELPAEESVIRLSNKEICHGCQGEFKVQELVDCPTCGVPSCKACAQGEQAPCPACDALTDVSSDDPCLAFVLSAQPHLAKGLRRWSASRLGPYVVTCWRRLGWWGMVVYHDGGAEPVLLTSFNQGPLDTLRMTVGDMLGGKR